MKKVLYFFVIILIAIACKDEVIDPITLPDPDPDSEEKVEVRLPNLRIEGCYLKNDQGEIVNLHGSWMTNNPYFNDSKWGNWNVNDCLNYNKKLLDRVLEAGWKLTFIRLHMDQYWSDTPNSPHEFTYQRFNEARFKKYLDLVYVPMAEYIQSKGIYVVLLPGISCPHDIEVGDGTNELLIKYWGIVSQHPKIQGNRNIMFELINEPVNILGTDGTSGNSNQGHFDNLKIYMQSVVDKIRENTDNIIWVPGLGYESIFHGYANNPIEGTDIGYSVHLYPGWMNSDGENGDGGIGDGGGYEPFQLGWDRQVKPVADFAPVIITEMDWAPSKYNASWGKSITGEVGGKGFGANFKYITDNSGNVSWLFFSGMERLAAFKGVPGTEGSYTFLNDPEACIWPCYHWFKEYANGTTTQEEGTLIGLAIDNADQHIEMLTGSSKHLLVKAIYANGTTCYIGSKATFTSSNHTCIEVSESGKIVAIKEGTATITIKYADAQGNSQTTSLTVTSTTFPLSLPSFNPSIFGEGTFNETTKTLITGQWGYGGWYYDGGVDISAYKYLIVELSGDNKCGAQFNLRDENNYWAKAAEYNFNNSRRIVVDIQQMYKTNDDGTRIKVDPTHIYYAGFWTFGNIPLSIDKVYFSETK